MKRTGKKKLIHKISFVDHKNNLQKRIWAKHKVLILEGSFRKAKTKRTWEKP
jgi:hypothetical protein